ncbi:hypothetical protein N2605_27300 [Bradyrhizobium yuanmingense]|uniref:DUF6786 family protein n=1 Tax=Bradyrhizobium yuanmingense TaxID=108015 RepID=UPI0021A7AD63|nr:DUF6786 family protein [Bradyrhizobium sp. CB1024]UWU83217.1 hypothetical protein N2605_27300 [Bradyrhizobium sp. CB1024]
MSNASYAGVIGNLRAGGIPVHELEAGGRIAVTLAAGRVIAMAFSADAPNLLWSHPQLDDVDLVKKPEQLTGGLGGDRLWFSPELAYHWDGEPDWETFANYRVPRTTDPGKYEFVGGDSRSITLRTAVELPVQGGDSAVAFHVERTIRVAEPPLPREHRLLTGIEYVGIESSHVLEISERTRRGVVDLWHLLQMPPGSVLVVPIEKAVAGQAKPLSYGLHGGWVEKPDHIVWPYGGVARAKFGLSTIVLTGRSAVFRQLADRRWCMIAREFPVDRTSAYCDHPHRSPRTDQAFQAWDGFGFGEMEFHSPALDAEHGPRTLRESDRLWAFAGPEQAIAALAEQLLEVDVEYILKHDTAYE